MRYIENRDIPKKYFIDSFEELDGKYIIKYADKKKRTIKANEKGLAKIRTRLKEQAKSIARETDTLETKYKSKKSDIGSGAFMFGLNVFPALYFFATGTPLYVINATIASFSGVTTVIDTADCIKLKKGYKEALKYKYYLENEGIINKNIEEIDKLSLKELKRLKESIVGKENLEYLKEEESAKKLTK